VAPRLAQPCDDLGSRAVTTHRPASARRAAARTRQRPGCLRRPPCRSSRPPTHPGPRTRSSPTTASPTGSGQDSVLPPPHPGTTRPRCGAKPASRSTGRHSVVPNATAALPSPRGRAPGDPSTTACPVALPNRRAGATTMASRASWDVPRPASPCGTNTPPPPAASTSRHVTVAHSACLPTTVGQRLECISTVSPRGDLPDTFDRQRQPSECPEAEQARGIAASTATKPRPPVRRPAGRGGVTVYRLRGTIRVPLAPRQYISALSAAMQNGSSAASHRRLERPSSPRDQDVRLNACPSGRAFGYTARESSRYPKTLSPTRRCLIKAILSSRLGTMRSSDGRACLTSSLIRGRT
jgi:hypothetical protein